MVRLTRIGASPTEGSSTRRIFGASISARPSASICCSPPDIEPASWRAALGKPREGLEADREIAGQLAPRGRAVGAEQQVLLDRELGKQPAAFRHQRDAEIDDLLGGAADEVVLDAVDLGDDRARRSAARCP